MSKIVMLRLPDKLAEKIQKIADRKGLGVSTAIREMICEQLNAPAMCCKDIVIAAYILKGLQNMHVYAGISTQINISQIFY